LLTIRHLKKGFVQFDVSEEQDAGRQGAVARREKEVREHEKRRLTGQAGKNLYLEALQLLLRSQVLWLVREKGHKPGLETVVRDLWDLRIRGSTALAGPEESGSGSNAAGGEAELEVFSSQVGSAQEDDTEEERASVRTDVRAQSWDPARGMAWPLPRVPDTLALCYLGCLLLRIPTRIGEIHEWVTTRNLPYERAVSILATVEIVDCLWPCWANVPRTVVRPPTGDARQDAFGVYPSSQVSDAGSFDEVRPVQPDNGSGALLSYELRHGLPSHPRVVYVSRHGKTDRAA
jgi:RNA polymerase I-specific transcription initiation factor RRN7